MRNGALDGTDGGWWQLAVQGPFPLACFGAKPDFYIRDIMDATQEHDDIYCVNPTPTDNYAPIMAASKYFYSYIGYTHNPNTPAAVPTSRPGRRSSWLWHLLVSDTLMFDRGIVFMGAGHGQYHDHANSRLHWPGGKRRIRAPGANWCWSGTAKLCGSILRDLYLKRRPHTRQLPMSSLMAST